MHRTQNRCWIVVPHCCKVAYIALRGTAASRKNNYSNTHYTSKVVYFSCLMVARRDFVPVALNRATAGIGAALLSPLHFSLTGTPQPLQLRSYSASLYFDPTCILPSHLYDTFCTPWDSKVSGLQYCSTRGTKLTFCSQMSVVGCN